MTDGRYSFRKHCCFGGIGESRPTGYIVNLHYFCGRLIIAPTAVIVDFAAVFIIFRRYCYCCFGGIGECRPTLDFKFPTPTF